MSVAQCETAIFGTRATTSNSILPSRTRCLASQIYKRNAVILRVFYIHTIPGSTHPYSTLPKTLTTAKQSEEKHTSKTWFLSAKFSGIQKYKVQLLEPRVLGSLTGFEVVNFRQAVT